MARTIRTGILTKDEKTGDEDHTIYPFLMAETVIYYDFPFIDNNVGNANYLKLKNLTLSYTFGDIVQNLRMSNAKVYVQGRNLFTITAKGTDIDPETAEADGQYIVRLYHTGNAVSRPKNLGIDFNPDYAFRFVMRVVNTIKSGCLEAES